MYPYSIFTNMQNKIIIIILIIRFQGILDQEGYDAVMAAAKQTQIAFDNGE